MFGSCFFRHTPKNIVKIFKVPSVSPHQNIKMNYTPDAIPRENPLAPVSLSIFKSVYCKYRYTLYICKTKTATIGIMLYKDNTASHQKLIYCTILTTLNYFPVLSTLLPHISLLLSSSPHRLLWYRTDPPQASALSTHKVGPVAQNPDTLRRLGPPPL